jgi:hypothetical protein
VENISLKKDYADGVVFDSTRYNQDQTAVETAINKIVGSSADGDSGADSVKTTPIAGVDGSTSAQGALEGIAALVLGVISSLASVEGGSSGANYVKATAIGGLDGDNVQDLMQSLKLAIDATATGSIPDGSLPNDKLADDIKVGSLALLTTVIKTSVVEAINEVVASAKSANDNANSRVPSTDVVTSATPSKILKLDSSGKLPANITGDANTVDTKHASDFATAAQGTKADAALPASSYTAVDVLTKMKTVDGSGSGLDADTLDGKHASEFLVATAKAADSDKIDGHHVFVQSATPTASATNDIWIKI